MKYKQNAFVLGVFLICLAFSMTSCKEKVETAKQDIPSLKWEVFSDEKLAKLKGQPTVVMFWADWCPDCVHIKEKAFSDPRVIESAKGINLLQVDCTDKEDKKVKVLQEKYGGDCVPTLIFFNRDGKIEDNWKLVEPRTAEELVSRFEKYFPKKSKLVNREEECCEDK